MTVYEVMMLKLSILQGACQRAKSDQMREIFAKLASQLQEQIDAMPVDQAGVMV